MPSCGGEACGEGEEAQDAQTVCKKLAVRELSRAIEHARAPGRAQIFHVWLQVLPSPAPCCTPAPRTRRERMVIHLSVHAAQGDIVDIEEASSSDPSGAEEEAVEDTRGPYALLDDGTGVVRLDLQQYCAQRASWRHPSRWLERGMYVMILAVVDTVGDSPAVDAYAIKDLSSEPDRLALWWCELIDAQEKARLAIPVDA